MPQPDRPRLYVCANCGAWGVSSAVTEVIPGFQIMEPPPGWGTAGPDALCSLRCGRQYEETRNAA